MIWLISSSAVVKARLACTGSPNLPFPRGELKRMQVPGDARFEMVTEEEIADQSRR